MNTKKTIDYFIHIFIRESRKRKLPDSEKVNYFYFYSEGYGKAIKDMLVIQNIITSKRKTYYLHWEGCCNSNEKDKKYAYDQTRVTCPVCVNAIYGHLSPVFLEKMSEAVLRLVEKWIPDATKRYFEKKDMRISNRKTLTEIMQESEMRKLRVTKLENENKYRKDIWERDN